MPLQKNDFDVEAFLNLEVAKEADRIDSSPEFLGLYLKKLLKGFHSKFQRPVNLLTNAELENVFGASGALAFCLSQHLAAVERLSGLEEWQKRNAKLWSQIACAEILVGLATTQLAKPNGAGIQGQENEAGFVLNGSAPWVCGQGIFQLLLVGCETKESVVFLLIEFPQKSNPDSMIGVEGQSNRMVCYNGTSTVRLTFKDRFVPIDRLVSRRAKTSVPQPRPTKYEIPEIGIGKAALRKTQELIRGSHHPKHLLIQDSVKFLKKKVLEIESLRKNGQRRDELTALRDDFNRAAVRLYSIAVGAQALLEGSLASRLQLEMILLDSILHAPQAFEKKIKRIANAVIV